MPGTAPTQTWHLQAVTPFPREPGSLLRPPLAKAETGLADAACGLPWPFAGVLGLQTNRGHAHRGKGHQTSQGTGEVLEREGGIELCTGPGNLIPSTGTPPSHHQGKGGTTDLSPAATQTGRTESPEPLAPSRQRRHPFSHSLLPAGCARLWTGVSSPHVKGNVSCPLPVLQQAAAEPSFSWRSFPSALRADSCRLPTDRGAFGRGERSGWGAWEQQPGQCRARSRAPRQREHAAGPGSGPGAPGARGSGGSAARDGEAADVAQLHGQGEAPAAPSRDSSCGSERAARAAEPKRGRGAERALTCARVPGSRGTHSTSSGSSSDLMGTWWQQIREMTKLGWEGGSFSATAVPRQPRVPRQPGAVSPHAFRARVTR